MGVQDKSPTGREGAGRADYVPLRVAAAFLAATVAVPTALLGLAFVAWIGLASLEYISPATAAAVIGFAVPAAAIAGSMVAGFAIRRPRLAVAGMLFCTQAVAILLLPAEIAAVSRSGYALSYYEFVPLMIWLAVPELPCVAIGAAIWVFLFRRLAPWFSGPEAVEGARAADAGDGVAIRRTVALAIGWYAVGVLEVAILASGFHPGY